MRGGGGRGGSSSGWHVKEQGKIRVFSLHNEFQVTEKSSETVYYAYMISP